MNLNEFGDYLNEIGAAAEKAFLDDDTELRREVYNEVERRVNNIDADQIPMWNRMLGHHKLGTTVGDIFEISNKDHREARAKAGLGVGDNWRQKVGTTIGRAGADIVSDNSRNIYWFLNAIQAATNIVNDAALSKADPDLRGNSYVYDESTGKPLEANDYTLNRAIKQGIANTKGEPLPGYRVRKRAGKGRLYEQTNVKPIIPTLLGLPASLAINNSLGLLNPGGGQAGYQAVVPNEENPTKTDNVLLEVGQKYVMGRTGNLLPFEEFKKVRPDVSKEEYRRYKAFKYDKAEDWNPVDDGQVTLLGGLIKYTNEGIHGPELQYLGRSAPITTGIIPLASAVAGTSLGLNSADRLPDKEKRTQADVDKYRKQVTRRSLGGGLGAYTVGAITGQLLENERRRRNKEENERDGSLYKN